MLGRIQVPKQPTAWNLW